MIPKNSRQPNLFLMRTAVLLQLTVGIAGTITPALAEEMHLIRGLHLLNENNYKEAVNELTRAIKADPKNFDIYDDRASAYYMLSKYKLAVADEDKSLALSSHFLGYLNRGGALLELARYDEAVQDFLKALQFRPNDADVYNNIGIAKYRQKKNKESLEALQKAKDLYTAGDARKSTIVKVDDLIRTIQNQEELKPIH